MEQEEEAEPMACTHTSPAVTQGPEWSQEAVGGRAGGERREAASVLTTPLGER